MNRVQYIPPKFNFNRFCHRIAGLIRPEARLLLPGAVISQQVRLADTSIYEGRMNPDQFALSGAGGIIPKASQGNWEDQEFHPTWTAFRGRTRRGAFHFYDPRYSPTAQLNTFLPLVTPDKPELAVVCDWEATWTGSYSSWSNLYAFMQGLLNAGFSAKQIYLYTGYYFWLDHSPNPITQPASLAWFAQFQLWLAWYADDPSIVRIPKPWTKLKWWQDTESGDGQKYGAETKGIDLSWYNGSAAEFESEYPAPSGVTPAPLPDAYIIRRPKKDYDLCFTGGSGALPLLNAVEHAAAHGWECAMNGGVGFDYVKEPDGSPSKYAIPRTSALSIPASDGTPIPYIRPAVVNGVVPAANRNPDYEPWCILAESALDWILIVTRGSGMNELKACQYAQTLGVSNAWVVDSDRSAQICALGNMLYWPYAAENERVPQAIGLKKKQTTNGGTMKGVATVDGVNVKLGSTVVTTLAKGEVVYGDPSYDSYGKLTDIINIYRVYKSDGVTIVRELSGACKVSIGSWLTVSAGSEPNPTPTPPPPSGSVTVVLALNEADGTVLKPKSIDANGNVVLG